MLFVHNLDFFAIPDAMLRQFLKLLGGKLVNVDKYADAIFEFCTWFCVANIFCCVLNAF